MLEFGEKLTFIPSAMAAHDLETLRQAGFSEREMVAVTAAAAYRNFITRIADGLGVELGTSGAGYYDAAVLHAFGVTGSAVGGSLYADRQESSNESGPVSRSNVGPAGARLRNGAGWIGTAAGESTANAAPNATPRSSPEALRNLAIALSLKSDTLAATLEFARLIDMGGSGLGNQSEAIIGVVVAAVLGLPYLGAHHAQRLLDTGTPPADLRALINNPAGETLGGRERETARFCEKLTRAPGTMARADVDTLRAAGFDDRGIVTIVAAASFANYLGRLAAALGVPPEAHLSETAQSAI